MIIDLDKKDLISLAKGSTPHYNIMEIPDIASQGSFTGGFVDKWSWNSNAFESYTKELTYAIYLLCKNSWSEEE